MGLCAGVRTFSLKELKIATDNFADRNILFRFGFAELYKGRLANGILVAIKRYEQLLQFRKQFETEFETMSIVNAHPNLLRLIGICVTKKEKILVHPYMANGSVVSFLRDRPESQPPLDWQIRKQIAFGAAKGLAYCTMDLNVKSSIVTSMLLICSEKSDVYGYGIFLLELITGQRAFDLGRLANDEDVMLLDRVKTHVKEKEWERIVDPDFGGNNYYIEEEVEQLIQIALLCKQYNPERRPNMSDIVRIILRRWLTINESWDTGIIVELINVV
ncbi:PREDICTED: BRASSINOSTEROID INSENSITIVE 1-associated receptor kinase 1-like [Erythranthe guttata]|uniref:BRASSINOSTEROID INSENSITIVE 1-associated receptor kinase 1-like n=1 Tax=Erythranthe guttata TaxID=4155 RepID=UPI00064DABB9|nr:PREDICTED: BRASSINOSTEROID INSENSITIVE 1-associated receptor kinase 1-like [Erythranthe guttata]|eukprot:XP_012845238.1 PREDICTED: BRASSINOSTEROID INSENSITIVE 1-associated receptor kinase 1-like [Erythranthe guttata]